MGRGLPQSCGLAVWLAQHGHEMSVGGVNREDGPERLVYDCCWLYALADIRGTQPLEIVRFEVQFDAARFGSCLRRLNDTKTNIALSINKAAESRRILCWIVAKAELLGEVGERSFKV